MARAHGVRIRPATASDAATIVALIHELAAFEGLSDHVRITEADVRRDGFAARPAFGCLIAERDGEALGFALYFQNYSTFEGRPGVYVEDLYVRPNARKLGVGRALLAGIAAQARHEGGARLDLWVLHWNPARHFYERLGFDHLEDWLPYRLSGAALEALADEGADRS